MSIIRLPPFRLLLIGIGIIFLIIFNIIRNKLQYENDLKQNNTTCHISMIESDRYLCESDEKWQKRRDLYSKQHDRNILTMNEYKNYFYENWFPEFQCQNEIRLGSGDGGKWACDIEYLKLKRSCLIYSLGSNGDFRFEQAAHKALPHCSIHTIDMVPYTCPDNVCTFHLAKIGDGQNGTKTLGQLMVDLNQTNSEIDILKIDIESSEYLFFHTLFSNNKISQFSPSVYIRQILIEIHLDGSRIFETNALFHLFNSQNYVIYHKELNAGFPYYACEYGLLKLNRKFFRGHL